MEKLTTSEIKNLRQNIYQDFLDRNGSFDKIINELIESQNTPKWLTKEDLICLMNPHFDDIYEYYSDSNNFISILRIFGQAVRNEFVEGKPIDPIMLEPIKANDLIIFENHWGYNKSTLSKIYTTEMRNPMDNLPVDQNTIDNLEFRLQVSGSEMLSIMYPDSDYDSDNEDEKLSDDKTLEESISEINSIIRDSGREDIYL